MRFYVYRRGYNAANNSLRGGGPETVLVAEVTAENAENAVAESVSTPERKQVLRQEDVTYRRAAGGYLWHSVPRTASRALCGFEPRSQHTMSGRGVWANIFSWATPSTIPAANRCPHCVTREADTEDDEESPTPGSLSARVSIPSSSGQ